MSRPTEVETLSEPVVPPATPPARGAGSRRRARSGAAAGLVVAVAAAGFAVLFARGGIVQMKRTFSKEVLAAGLEARGRPGAVVTEADLAGLLEPVQRYFRFMGVVGRARDTSFRAHLHAQFRPTRDSPWLPAEIWQYSSQPDVARIFHMKLRMKGLPVYGRDTYVAGRGRMLIRPLDLFTIEDSQGSEYDVGELVTYLNDAVLFAPSMLLAPDVRFTPVDAASFDVALTNRGTTVSARVLVDERGAVRDFSTTDRFRGRTRARWTTPIERWEVVDGRPMPKGGRAVWHLPDGELEYARIEPVPGSFVFNVPPGA